MPSMKTEHRRGAASVTVSTSGICVERIIHAAPESGWDILTDTTQWPRWGPSVSSVSCSDRYIQKNASGRIWLPVGLSVPFRVTEYEHGTYWGWKVAGIRATGHRLIPYGDSTCKICFEMPVYWLPYSIVCHAALQRIAFLLEGKGLMDRNAQKHTRPPF